MIELPVPDCAAPEEMLTMTAVARLAQQRDKGADRRERPAHIGGQHLVDQIVVERVEVVVRHHPGKPGGIDQDVGATELLPDRGGDPLDLGGVLERQIHRLVAAAGQFADHGSGAVDALVVADDDARSGLGKQARAGGADPAAGAGDDGNLAVQGSANLRRHHSLPSGSIADATRRIRVLSPRSPPARRARALAQA